MERDALRDLLTRLSTSSLCDASEQVRVLDGVRPVGRARRLAGPARTVAADGGPIAVLRGIAAARPGEVVVVEGGGGAPALAGELFATEARRVGLAGLVVDGNVRDLATLATLDLPVWARGVVPHAGSTHIPGRLDVDIACGGVRVTPGDLIVGDDDGVVVVPAGVVDAVVAAAERIEATEARVLTRLRAGEPLAGLTNLADHVAAIEGGDRRHRFEFRL